MNARFWVWYNAQWIKLMVPFMGSITLIEGGGTEEGYDCQQTIYTNDGEGVHQEWERDAMDCDGRLTDRTESYCPMESLSAREWETDNGLEVLYLPRFTKMRRGYRDYAAEAMNY